MDKIKQLAKDKRNVLIFGLIIIIIVLVALIFINSNNDKPLEEESGNDAIKFAEEYTEVGEDNLYVYRTYDEIIKILDNGTGVILFGFPECPWCQRYAVYLNDVAKELDYEKIYYYNILEDRKNNTEEYQNIVSIIGEYLQFDEEGNKRVYVPAVVAVNKGEIVGFDDETSLDTKGFDKPDDYWTEEEITDLKTKLNTMLMASHPNMCNSCNED